MNEEQYTDQGNKPAQAFCYADNLNVEWHPFDTIPRDRTPVLVCLEKELLGSVLQVGRFGGNGIDIIASKFAFDCPKVLGWTELPMPIKA